MVRVALFSINLFAFLIRKKTSELAAKTLTAGKINVVNTVNRGVTEKAKANHRETK